MAKISTHDQILLAAKSRFGHYGFNKTTMVEIANDCDMSAANIYRHFNGKNDIIAALATELLRSQEDELSIIVSSRYPSSSAKLHAFFQKALISTQTYVTEQSKIKEMVDFICKERFDLVQAHSQIIVDLIGSILKEGKLNSEFSIEDIQKTATSFKEATVMFHTPLFMEMYCTEDLQASCENIINLLISGVAK